MSIIDIFVYASLTFAMLLTTATYIRTDFSNEIQYRRFIALMALLIYCAVAKMIFELGDIVQLLKEIKP